MYELAYRLRLKKSKLFKIVKELTFQMSQTLIAKEHSGGLETLKNIELKTSKTSKGEFFLKIHFFFKLKKAAMV